MKKIVIKKIREFIIGLVKKVLPKEWSYNSDDILVNPTGFDWRSDEILD